MKKNSSPTEGAESFGREGFAPFIYGIKRDVGTPDEYVEYSEFPEVDEVVAEYELVTVGKVLKRSVTIG